MSSAIIQIRATCQTVFEQIPDKVEQVKAYTTPKVQRMLEILRHFKPDDKNGLNGLRDHLDCEVLQKIPIARYIKGIDDVGKTLESITKDLETLKTKIIDLQKGGGERSPVKAFRTRRKFYQRQPRQNAYANDPDSLCGIIFCNSKLIAKSLFSLLCEMSKHDPHLQYLNVQYTVEKVIDVGVDPKEAEFEHRKQEEVLKRFRMHECNLLIGTAILEEGIELPKCNLVIRWDPPDTYQSYVQCKGRARALKAYHVMLVSTQVECDAPNGELKHKLGCLSESEDPQLYVSSDDDSEYELPVNTPCAYTEAESQPDAGSSVLTKKSLDECTHEIIEKLAAYMEIEKMLIHKCENIEPPERESDDADLFTSCIEPFKPSTKMSTEAPYADLTTAIAHVNKYCAKLPSDTFTKLTPLWRCSQTVRHGSTLYQYTVRLPINSPLKRDIYGVPMPTRILARRVAAMVTCKALHGIGELDDALQPIGKEGFSAFESDWENFDLEEEDEKIINENLEPRPGTTKRRQYYYKKVSNISIQSLINFKATI